MSVKLEELLPCGPGGRVGRHHRARGGHARGQGLMHSARHIIKDQTHFLELHGVL